MNNTASFQVLPSSEEVESASLPRVTPILGCFMKACALWQTTMTPFGSNTAETFEFGFCNGVACGVSQLSPLSAECETYIAPRLVRKNCASRPSRNGPTMDPFDEPILFAVFHFILYVFDFRVCLVEREAVV